MQSLCVAISRPHSLDAMCYPLLPLLSLLGFNWSSSRRHALVTRAPEHSTACATIKSSGKRLGGPSKQIHPTVSAILGIALGRRGGRSVPDLDLDFTVTANSNYFVAGIDKCQYL